jgi:hypothetical protein
MAVGRPLDLTNENGRTKKGEAPANASTNINACVDRGFALVVLSTRLEYPGHPHDLSDWRLWTDMAARGWLLRCLRAKGQLQATTGLQDREDKEHGDDHVEPGLRRLRIFLLFGLRLGKLLIAAPAGRAVFGIVGATIGTIHGVCLPSWLRKRMLHHLVRPIAGIITQAA